MSESEKSQSEGDILNDFIPKLIRLAESKMSSQLKQKVGADDVAISVIGSVVRMKNEGTLKVAISGDAEFWLYLVGMSNNKINNRAREFRTQKRSVAAEMPISEIEMMLRDYGDPTDDDGARAARFLEQLQASLEDEDIVVLNGKINRDTDATIAKRLNLSTRTVKRKWRSINEQIESMFDDFIL